MLRRTFISVRPFTTKKQYDIEHANYVIPKKQSEIIPYQVNNIYDIEHYPIKPIQPTKSKKEYDIES